MDYVDDMKKNIKTGFILFLLTAFVWSQETSPVSGFVDSDHDGINDQFQDANGDGINDVNGQPYPHDFKYQDRDNDGHNDLWADADGDGVNDLLANFQGSQRWVDMDGDGIMDEGSGMLRGNALKAQVLDSNGDGKNDITGEEITRESLGGYKYGQVDEESGIRDRGFVDADGDGMNDRSAYGTTINRGQSQGVDVFIDLDGDGISDDRGLGRLRAKEKGRQSQ